METIPRTEKNSIGSLLKAAENFGVEIEVLDEKAELRLFKKNGQEVLVLEHVPDIIGHVPSEIARDKVLTKRLLEREQIPVPHGFSGKNTKYALRMIAEGNVKYPLVVKPVNGGMGQAVAVGIKDEYWLQVALKEVFKYNRRKLGKPESYLIEEYIPGDDFRFLFLDGEVLTVLMRKPAYVIGDGERSISELIAEYNSQPGVDKKQPLCPIARDNELKRNLDEQGLQEETILPRDKKLYLRKNANISTGGRSFECADKAHPEFKKLSVKIAELFKFRFCAVDLIAEDISKFEKFAVIEVNNTQGFDIHEVPYAGKPFPVAEHLVRAMFKNPGITNQRSHMLHSPNP